MTGRVSSNRLDRAYRQANSTARNHLEQSIDDSSALHLAGVDDPGQIQTVRLINQCTFSRVARNVPLSSLKNFPFSSKFFMSQVPV